MKIATRHLQFLSLRENTRAEAGNASKHAKANKEMINACMLPFFNEGGNENLNTPFTISFFKGKHASWSRERKWRCETKQRINTRITFSLFKGLQIPFLANDVTFVTSWLMSSKLENRAFRYTVSVFNLPEGVFCEMLDGGVPVGHWNPYLISGTYPYTLYGSATPGLWSFLHWQVSIN